MSQGPLGSGLSKGFAPIASIKTSLGRPAKPECRGRKAKGLFAEFRILAEFGLLVEVFFVTFRLLFSELARDTHTATLLCSLARDTLTHSLSGGGRGLSVTPITPAALQC